MTMPAAHRAQFASFVLLSLAASSALSGVNVWTSLGPDGGQVYDVQASAGTPNTLYAATANGFYRSLDSGATWQKTEYLTNSARFRPVQVVPDPVDSNAVFVLGGDVRLAYSTDRGATLRSAMGGALSNVSPGRFRIAAAKSDATVYYFADNKVYRTDTRSFAWEKRGELPTTSTDMVWKMFVDPNNSALVYVLLLGEGVYRSVDGAATWEKIYAATGVVEDAPYSFAIDPKNPARLWLGTRGTLRVSNTGGATWQTLTPTGDFLDIDVDPTNSSVVYASNINNEVLRTTNGGSSWSKLTVPSLTNWGAVSIDPLDSAKLYLFNFDRIFVSTNSGATWNVIDAGIVATSAYQFSRSIGPSGKLYFMHNRGLAYVERDGMWVGESINLGLAAISGVDPPRVSSVISVGSSQDVLLTIVNSTKVARSVDFGGSWTEVGSPIPPASGQQIFQLVGSRGGPQLIYAATSLGVFRSNDLGGTWTAINTGLPVFGYPSNALADAITTVNGDPNRLYLEVRPSQSTATGQLYKSTDSGVTWTATPLQGLKGAPTKLTPDPKDPLTLYAVTADGISKTVDGGATWSSLSSVPKQTVDGLAIDPGNAKNLYMAASFGVSQSVDGGATWKSITPVYQDMWSIFDIVANPSKPGQILIATQGAGVKEITVAPDLEVAFTSPGPTALSNKLMEYTATFTNRSLLDATNILAELEMPNAFTSYTVNLGATAGACTAAGTKLVCTVPTLKSNASWTVVVGTTPSASGPFVVNGKINGEQTDAVPTNNVVSMSVMITAPTPPANSGSGGGGAFSMWLLMGLASLQVRRAQRRACSCG